jgi:hypothetical protein
MDLVAGEFPPAGGGDATQGEAADADADESLDGHAEELEHIAQFAVAGLEEGDANDGVGALELDELELGDGADGDGALGAVFAGLALAEAAELDANAVEQGLIDAALDEGLVGLGDVELGVGEGVGEVAVVGHEDEARGLEVEAADGEEPGLGGVIDDLGDGGAVELGLVGGGDEHAFGLVDHQVELAFRLAEGAAVDEDAIGVGVDEDGQAADDLAIDADATLLDEVLAGTTGGDAGVGHDALEADAGLVLLGWACLVSCHDEDGV